MSQTPVRIRKATESDVAFIFSSWLKSYRQAPAVRDVVNTIYYTEHHKVIERLLQQCEVYVACNDKDPSEIYGFACGEVQSGVLVIHMIYVKHTYRRLGIGQQLLNTYNHNPEAAAIYTHHTMAAKDLAPKYKFVYSPYIALIPDYRTPVQKEEPKNEQ